MAKAGLGHRSGTAGVKMGVAGFAACLLAVVDGCFSLAADAARRWMQLANKKKCYLSESKNEYKIQRIAVHVIRYVGFRKTPEK